MFRYRVTLFSLFGFKVSVDASWLLLAVLITWSLAVGYFPQTAPGLPKETYWWLGVAGLIGFAFSIVFHELSHSLVARRFDMPIRGITLFVFGGVAEMEDEPPGAKAEFWMAIAGPLMSFFLAFVFFLLGGLFVGPDAAKPTPLAVLFGLLAYVNTVLGVFNLVPAFPLDGGRVLRAALWYWKGDIGWATRVAATAGSIFGFVLIAIGLFNVVVGNFVGGLWWFLIGLFLRAAAGAEATRQIARSTLSGLPVSRFMSADVIAVPPELPLGRLIEDYFYHHYFTSFPVSRDGRLIGCVSLKAVKAAAADHPEIRTVESVMEACPDNQTVGPDADSAKALRQMQMAGVSRLFVTRNDRLVGILALRDLLTFLAIKAELSEP
ncbi:MAG: site-2 protease family protein [Alphaproteobacteria bacterium]